MKPQFQGLIVYKTMTITSLIASLSPGVVFNFYSITVRAATVLQCLTTCQQRPDCGGIVWTVRKLHLLGNYLLFDPKIKDFLKYIIY